MSYIGHLQKTLTEPEEDSQSGGGLAATVVSRLLLLSVGSVEWSLIVARLLVLVEPELAQQVCLHRRCSLIQRVGLY